MKKLLQQAATIGTVLVMLIGTVWFLASPPTAHAASTLTVTTTADVSSCTKANFSLRCALNQANKDGSGDTIAFTIPPTDSGCSSMKINGSAVSVCTLTPTISTGAITMWPILTANNTTLNGYTQPGAKANTNPLSAGDNAILTVRLDGGSSLNLNGFLVQGTGDTVKGFSFTNFSTAIEAGPQTGQVTVQGNFVGLEPDGVTNEINGTGVEDNGNGVTLGGTHPADSNVISGNSTGVSVSNQDTVQGNIIGLDAAGTAPVVNLLTGGLPGDGIIGGIVGGMTSGAGNVISGNASGIRMAGSGGLVEGNLIGTDVTGTVAIGNEEGITMSRASNATIGGTTAVARNIISGNFNFGIDMGDGSGNVVEGNYIGTDITGEVALPNGGQNGASAMSSAGILISTSIQGTSNNTVGGTTSAARNVISGNAFDGVEIEAEDISGGTVSTQNNVVEGNFIGTDATGTKALGNGTNGVFVGHPQGLLGLIENNSIKKNIIAHNGQSGVLIGGSASDTTVHTPISQNSIFANGSLGLDLAPQSTVNTSTAPPGPNDYTAAPVISQATTTMISGTAPANTTVEVFIASNGTGDMGHGGGQTFLGSVTSNSHGSWSLTLASGQVTSGQLVTATATTTGITTETSEFAANVKVH